MKKPQKLADVLKKKFTKKEREFLITSFDMVGNIAIIEVREELRHKEKIIGAALLEMHKNVKTVCRKEGEHSGIYRTQKLRIIAGKRTKETTHRESSCMLKLNVEKCYFSVRSGTERLRIAGLVDERAKKGNKEKVLIMFSGIAPFACVIGRNSEYEKIVCIEMNPAAHKYAQENIIKNKLKDTNAIIGDVRKIVPKLNEKFDRIVMPLPRTAEEFLETALIASKKGTIIHLYGFLAEDEFEDYKKKIKKICKESDIKAKILRVVKCGQFSPRIFRICVDFEIQ
jgi:tRNA (guanine37-N1)-methyltransferase